MLPSLKTLEEKYENIAKFFIVYISEAHAKDEWPVGDCSKFNQHTTLEEKITAAFELASEFDISTTILIDDTEKKFETMFASWPIRYHILENELIHSVGRPVDCVYRVCDIERDLLF